MPLRPPAPKSVPACCFLVEQLICLCVCLSPPVPPLRPFACLCIPSCVCVLLCCVASFLIFLYVSVFLCFAGSVFRCFFVSFLLCFAVSVFRCFDVSVFLCFSFAFIQLINAVSYVFKFEKQKLTAPRGLPRRSPTLVLTRPCAA